MWCRAILTVTLLACTFHRTNGQSHDTKDLLCVLILSGLQKDDLDVALLRKLKRHNVNIDDLDNEDIRYECKHGSGSSSDNETINDVPKSLRKQFHTNETTISASDKFENQTIEVNTTAQDNITKLIKLFSKITPEVNIQTTKEDTTTTKVVTTETPRAMPERNSITYINKVLQQFFAHVTMAPTTTTQATTVNDLKSILNEIKDMLKNKTENDRKVSTEIKNSQQEENYDDDGLKIKVYTKAIYDKIANKMKHLRREKESVELLNQYQEFSDERPIKNYRTSSSLNQPLPKQQTTRTDNIQNDGKVIPVDMIKDIAESVKALVLQDLKKEMSTTTSTSTSTTTTKELETTTVATSPSVVVTTEQENDFAKFMHLFQQFKNNIPVVNSNFTTQTTQEITIKTSPAPTLPTPPYNPYNNPIISHIIRNMQIPHSVPNLNRELQSLPVYKTPSFNRIEQLNIFNPKHDTHPIMIQSNVGQIPPLKIPMIAPPIKMVYQNILVTTENTFEYFKNIHKQKTSPNINTQYSHTIDNRKPSSKPQYAPMVEIPNYNYQKSYDHTMYHPDVERMKTPYYIGHNYYPKNEYANTRTRNRNFERFHEKLERPDRNDWPQYSNDNEHIHIEKMRVSPRQQKPLNDNKPKFDDKHFKNFLKTQQKVNNMLERILATKTIEGTKSVEIP